MNGTLKYYSFQWLIGAKSLILLQWYLRIACLIYI
jgi:hypothetical protein